ncbi:MAG: ABC transporter permease, partial [Clostridia bacterium]|nr:ABC transporter permease [Clostridia bacterium]
MIVFTKRNLMVFFKDKSAVFFSLLATLIIVALYLLFLGDTWSNS